MDMIFLFLLQNYEHPGSRTKYLTFIYLPTGVYRSAMPASTYINNIYVQ